MFFAQDLLPNRLVYLIKCYKNLKTVGAELLKAK